MDGFIEEGAPRREVNRGSGNVRSSSSNSNRASSRNSLLSDAGIDVENILFCFQFSSSYHF